MRIFKTIAFLAILLLALPLSAQHTKEQLASYYYSHQQLQEAATLYEELYEQNLNKYYYQMLLDTYLQLDRTRDAEKLVDQRIKNNPRDLYLYVDRAAVYLKKDDPKHAEKQYEEALSHVTPDGQQLSALTQAFETAGRRDLMLRAYQRARQVAKNNYLYVNEIAAIHGAMGNYDAMTQEYLDLLDNSPGSIGSIQVSLQRSLSQTSDPRLSDGLRQALVDRIHQQPDNRSYIEMMIWYSLQVKDFEFALAQAQAVDARFPDVGTEQVYRVANIALTNGDLDVARDGFQTLVDKGNTTPFYFNSRLGLLNVQFSRLSRDFPLPTKELQNLKHQYDDALTELGKKESTLPIMRNYATLLAYHLNDIQAAADLLYDALEIPKLPLKKLCEVKLDLGDLLLFAGEPWEASLLYMQVEKSYKNDALGAQAKLSNARLSYYNNDFLWAKSQLDVLRASTSKLVANDAMQLSLLIADNMEVDSTFDLLSLYAAADLYLYRNMLDSAWARLDQIQQQTLSHPLLDEVILQKARIRIRQQQYQEADSLLAQLYQFYPDDLLADDALLLRAQLNEQQLKNIDIALQCYENIILNHPSSLHADLARRRYNQLKK